MNDDLFRNAAKNFYENAKELYDEDVQRLLEEKGCGRMQLVETSLNLRVEKGKQRSDYCLPKWVAEEQLSLGAEVYCNVEYMECCDAEYMVLFEQAGYIAYKALDSKHLGILCMVKDYAVESVGMFSDPNMLHLALTKDGKTVQIIVVRILVANGGDDDYRDRRVQWDRVIDYISSIRKKSKNVVVVGDFNHGVISENYSGKPRRFFNFQIVNESLAKCGMKPADISGTSYREYQTPDHLFTTSGVKVIKAEFLELFGDNEIIGIPDHKLIVSHLIYK